MKSVDWTAAYGGADWSKNADVINASYGTRGMKSVSRFDSSVSSSASLRALPKLRGGKGLIFVKAAGNNFVAVNGEKCLDFAGLRPVTCHTTADDTTNLEPVVISVAAVNAKGVKSTYSTAGAVNWISGLGGEYADGGGYGEGGTGPQVFSTDLSGCNAGYSRTGISPDRNSRFLQTGTPENVKDNTKCNYSHMNGTSAATPTISGVVALMLSANPKLTWRDVREILRATARQIDPTYVQRDSRNVKFDLMTGKATTDTGTTFSDGDTTARLDFGWVKNAAGYSFSNWYGFGFVDAAAAVKMALSYTSYKDASLTLDAFKAVNSEAVPITYGRVQKIGSFTPSTSGTVDMLQLRLSGDVCVGRIGFYVKSPAGTMSVLSAPNNAYGENVNTITDYGLGSVAFYGERMTGTWEVYSVSVNGNAQCKNEARGTSLKQIEYRLIAAK